MTSAPHETDKSPTSPADRVVVPLRPGVTDGRRQREPEPPEHHFEIALDDEPDPGRQPVYVDVVTHDHERRPIVPAHLRGRSNIAASVKRAAGRTAHRVAYHGVRAPQYTLFAGWWAAVGVFRLAGRQLRWWWHPELSALMGAAAKAGDLKEGARVHDKLRVARTARGLWLLAEATVLAVAVSLLAGLAPWWVQAVVVALAVPVLAHIGRPLAHPIVSPATVTPRYRKLNPDIVRQAYYSAGLGHPDKPGQRVEFAGTMSGHASGDLYISQVMIDLPYGKTFADAVKVRPGIASGLDVTGHQVFLTKDKSSERRHTLVVIDRDPLAIPAGHTPLLNCKPRDIWRPAPFGRDERGRPVTVPLMWISILIGAQPRKGKTFSARLLALYAALDPYVKIFVVDGKNSPDWRKFLLVAEMLIFGTHPNRDGDPVELLLMTLRAIKKHIQKVNEILSALPPEVCPEGKLTRELARDPRYPDLRVWMLVMEEFQVYFELEDQDLNKEIAGLLAFIQAVGPSSGVILLSSSQKPSGVGAGDVQRLFNRYRDNHAVRFALKCGNRTVSEAVLGGDAYGEGFDASSLPSGPEYLGVGYLYGLTDETPLVRTFLADHVDTEKILVAARQLRERTGTLSGMAAGEEVARQFRDVLADVRSVFYAGEARISWHELASRLAETMPEHYADISSDTISAQVRAFGVPSKNVKDWKHFRSGTGQGFDLSALDAAIHRREIEGRQ